MPNLANPIQVVLNNIDQQPILFIPDGGQDLLLEVNNFSGQKLVFASDTDIFRMTFRPSTLVKPVPLPSGAGLIAQPPLADQGIQLVASDPKTLPANSDLLLGTQEGNNWTMTVNETGDGFVTMSFRLKPDVSRSLSSFDPNDANASRLVLRLGNVQPAASSQGTRSTPVDVQFNVKAGDTATAPQLTGIEKAHLTLLNLSRTAYLAEERSNAITNSRSVPFGAEFIGSNNVFNDGQPSEIHLRVRNLTDAPLNLSPGLSKVALRFRAGDDQPLDNVGLLVPVRAAVTTEPLGPNGVIDPWSWDGTNHEATATANAGIWPQGAEFQIKISITNTTRPSGYAPLSLEFTNLPDHPDGKLELFVQIGPLFIDNEAAVGITRPLRFYGSENSTKVTVPPPASMGIDNTTGELQITAAHNVNLGTKGGLRLGDSNGTANHTLDANGLSVDGSGPLRLQHTGGEVQVPSLALTTDSSQGSWKVATNPGPANTAPAVVVKRSDAAAGQEQLTLSAAGLLTIKDLLITGSLAPLQIFNAMDETKGFPNEERVVKTVTNHPVGIPAITVTTETRTPPDSAGRVIGAVGPGFGPVTGHLLIVISGTVRVTRAGLVALSAEVHNSGDVLGGALEAQPLASKTFRFLAGSAGDITMPNLFWNAGKIDSHDTVKLYIRPVDVPLEPPVSVGSSSLTPPVDTNEDHFEGAAALSGAGALDPAGNGLFNAIAIALPIQ
jgi:hypothetical protein